MNQRINPPALDGSTALAAPPLPIPGASKPQDWERLVSPGHVLKERLVRRMKRISLVGLAAFAAMFYVAPSIPQIAGDLIPTRLYQALVFDPDHYVGFSSGVTGSYRLHWISDIPTGGGLSGEEWIRLVEAVRRDLRDFGPDAAEWASTADLANTPRITRPAKVFEEGKLASLATGVVSVPEDFGRASTIDVVAAVDGQLMWVAFAPAGCVAFFGAAPVLEGADPCVLAYPYEDRAVEHLMPFRPASATLKIEE